MLTNHEAPVEQRAEGCTLQFQGVKELLDVRRAGNDGLGGNFPGIKMAVQAPQGTAGGTDDDQFTESPLIAFIQRIQPHSRCQ